MLQLEVRALFFLLQRRRWLVLFIRAVVLLLSQSKSCSQRFMVNKIIILLAGSKGLSRSMVLSRSAAS